jgi:NAD(P)-dependent dehydrogenase (short-subunit alcohol dehydrogenase family)
MRTVVIYGGSGAIGSAAAWQFARQGDRVCLGARRVERAEALASRIRAEGWQAEAFAVDVLDAALTADATAGLARRTGGIDIVVNATSFLHDQGTPLEALTPDAFQGGFTPFLAAMFNIAKAAAPQMVGARGGAILAVTAPAATLAVPGHLGHILGCAATEAFGRALAGELGPRNIRVVCLRSHAIADAVEAGSFTAELFAPKARAAGLSVPEWLAGAAGTTLLNRLPTLAQVAGTLCFLASDHAGSITGTVVNLTAGFTTD